MRDRIVQVSSTSLKASDAGAVATGAWPFARSAVRDRVCGPRGTASRRCPGLVEAPTLMKPSASPCSPRPNAEIVTGPWQGKSPGGPRWPAEAGSAGTPPFRQHPCANRV